MTDHVSPERRSAIIASVGSKDTGPEMAVRRMIYGLGHRYRLHRRDQLGVVQTKQDLEYCREKFPALICRAVSSQFIADDHIAMFELTVEDDFVKIVDEKHYKLVPSNHITPADLDTYGVGS